MGYHFLFLDSQLCISNVSIICFLLFVHNLCSVSAVVVCNTLFLLTHQEFKSPTGDPFTDYKWLSVGKSNQDIRVPLTNRVGGLYFKLWTAFFPLQFMEVKWEK